MKSGMPDVPTKEEWLAANLEEGGKVGIDPKLFSIGWFSGASWAVVQTESHSDLAMMPSMPTASVKALQDALSSSKQLLFLPSNLIDAIWTSQPPRPDNPATFLDLQYSGLASSEKLAGVRESMSKKGCKSLVLSALDELAWLYNLRGSDIAYNPVFFAYSIVNTEGNGQTLYLDESKLDQETRNKLPPGTTIKPYGTIYSDLAQLSSLSTESDKIWLDSRSNYALLSAVKSGKASLEDGKNPVLLAKAVKNEVEMEGFRKCHLRDAVALVS